MSKPSELDDPGLVRVHLQRERLQPLLQVGQEPVRMGEVLGLLGIGVGCILWVM
jgi:hypothetical protein